MGIFNSIDFGPTPSFGPDFNAQWTKRAGALYDALQLLEDNIVGTVSQSGGVPDGAFFQRGSNANGVYVRLADGTQICQRDITPSSQSASFTALGHHFSPVALYPFAATFAATPACAISRRVPGQGGLVSEVADNSTSDWEVRFFAAATFSGVDPGGCSLLAIGRWF